MPEELISLSPLAYAFGEPVASGVLRQQAEDFNVEEVLGFEPEGEGEHVFLWIEKTGLNTQQLAEQLAKFAKVPARQVSYSGMKDRHAVTRQWFSVHLPGNKTLEWESLNSPAINVLKHSRHLRKLRRGAHRANRFVITIKELAGDVDNVLARLETIATRGVPNYFGEQRFGHGGRNLQQAQRWFNGEFKPKRHQQGLYLSAARSYLFNQLLTQRVVDKNWDQLLPGELAMLDGSHSIFSCATETSGEGDLAERLLSGDIHPTGPMAGKAGNLSCSAEVLQLESAVLQTYPALCEGLEKAGLSAQRRALRMIPSDLQWQLQASSLEIAFSLPSGCFATAVVRELVNY